MMTKNLFYLLVILFSFTNCGNEKPYNFEKISKSEPRKNDIEKKAKPAVQLKIENGMNQGIRANAKLGIINPIIYTTSMITNVGADPIQLKMALSKEYNFPSFCGDSTYKVFLLPKDLTPDTAILTNTLLSGENDFFKFPLDKASTLIKNLEPGEFCVITMATLYPGSSNCEVLPRAVFSHSNREDYYTCDALNNPEISASDSRLEIGLKLEFYNQRKFIAPEDHCTIIPCGEISFSKL